MAKQLNVDLNIRANTSTAKQQLQELQTILTKLSATNSAPGLSKDLTDAGKAAQQLSVHLNNAFNASTGNFDLSRLDKSLKTSGTNVQALSANLLKAGGEGQQAFLKLAQTIATADRPLISLNSKLKEFSTTMANTIRWQASSSLLHGMMGTMQQAWGYAQDLNASLNDIRIVTGSSVEEMAAFADQANRAAKALSTTTTEYTKASLIYYQQGLSDREVQERTDVTIKMANATGEAAQTVSDQLTAVWNNFDDGSKALEYYADVMTALGAATASSTDEISEGLNKFASVAETVGLSYEYAASALATVTASTRQSADIVGTAFKTLFARIQGLNLGETLDDGTTLNKYSQALASVGINIKESNGEIKEMDVILDEMGNKWTTISKDQQIALAQTVAGTRQYTQLVSLMDNWDFFKENVQTSYDSEGTLQQQAEIYEESWAAARDRVRASLEDIYDSLINDNAIIKITDDISGATDALGAFIDGIGGMKGIVLSASSFFMASFANKITGALDNLKYNFTVFTQGAAKSAEKISKKMNKSIENEINSPVSKSKAYTTGLQNAEGMIQARTTLQLIEDQLTDREKQLAQAELNTLSIMQQQTQELAKQVDEAQKKRDLAVEVPDSYDRTKTLEDSRAQREEALKRRENSLIGQGAEANEIAKVRQAILDYSAATDTLTAARSGYVKVLWKSFTAEQQNSVTLGKALDDSADHFVNALSEIGRNNTDDLSTLKQSLQGVQDELISVIGPVDSVKKEFQNVFQATDIGDFQDRVKNLANGLRMLEIPAEEVEKILSRIGLRDNVRGYKNSVKELTEAEKELKVAQDAVNQAVANFNPTHTASGIETFTKLASVAGQTAMAINSVRSMVQAWNNDDLSAGEKLTTSLMSVSMLVPTTVNGLNTLKSALTSTETWNFTSTILQSNNALKAFNASLGGSARIQMTSRKATAMGLNILKNQNHEQFYYNLLTRQGYTEEQAQLAIKNAKILAQSKEALASKLASANMTKETILTKLKTAETKKETAAIIAKALAQKMANPYILVAVAATAALTAAIALAVKESNKDAKAAEKAAEATKNLAEATDSAKQELDNLKSSFDAYDTAVEKLNNCTRGTQEWHDALKAVNDEVLNILANSPDLASSIKTSRDANGMLVFENRDEIIEQAEEKARNAQYASLMGNVTANEKQLASDRTNLKRTLAGSRIDSYDGDQILYNPGQVIADRYQELTNLTTDEFEAKIREFTAGALEIEGVTNAQYESMIDSLMDFQDNINNLGESANETALALENSANIIAETQLGEDYSETAKEIASEEYERAYKSIYEDIEGLNNKIGINAKAGQNDSLDKLWDRYSEATSTNYSLDKNAVLGNKDNRYFQYLDNGETKKVSLEEAAAAIAAAEALKQLADSADGATKFLSDIGTSGTDFVNKLVSSRYIDENGEEQFDATGFLQSLSQSELTALLNGDTSVTGLDENQLNTFLTDYLKIDIGELETLFETGAENLRDQYENNYTGYERFQADNIIGKDSSYESKSNYINARRAAQNRINEEGVRNNLGSIARQNVGNEGLTNFFEGIANIDFNNEDAVEQIRALQEEYNISGNAVESFIVAIAGLPKTLNVATNEIVSTRKKLSDVIGMEVGDELDADSDAIQTMKDAGIALDDYFTLTADGTYVLTAAVEDFQKVINGITLDNLKAQLGDYQTAAANAQGKWSPDDYTVGEQLGSDPSEEAQRAAVDYIQQFGDIDYGTIGTAGEILDFDLENGSLSDLNLEDINAMLLEIAKSSELTQQQFLSLATSLEDLKNKASEVGATDEVYSQGLIALASGYENCTNEIIEYQNALGTANEEQARLTLETAIGAGEMAEAYDLAGEDIENYAKYLADMADEDERLAETLDEDAKTLNEVAKELLRYNRAIESATDNMDDWFDAINNNEKLSEEWYDGIQSLQEAMADLLDLDIDDIEAEILANVEAQELFRKAIEGDTEAYRELLGLVNISNFGEENLQAAAEAVGQFADDVKNRMMELANLNLDVGELITLGNPDGPGALVEAVFRDAYNAAVAGGASMAEAVDAANAELAKYGITMPEVEIVEMTVNGETPQGYKAIMGETSIIQNADGTTSIQESYSTTPTPGEITEQTFQVPAFKEGAKAVKTSTGTGYKGSSYKPKSSGGGGGGGSSKKKPAEKVKKSDTVDRYKEVTDKIDDVTDAFNKASTAADRLYGNARIKQMEKMGKALEKEIDLLKQKRQEAEAYLKEDQEALNTAAKEAGVSFTYDKNGNITNYTEQMTALWQELDNAITKANKDGNATENEQEKIDAIQERIDKVKEAQEQYEETRELIEDIDQEVIDKFNEWQDNNFEMLNYKLEIKIELNDAELEKLEYYLDKYDGDFYKMAESIALVSDQIKVAEDSLNDYKTAYDELTTAYKNNEISQDAFVEGSKELQSNIIDQLSELNELKQTMKEYYGETLDSASEELEIYTDRLEHQNEVLEHFASMMELLGKQTDYETIGKILEGQASLAESAVKIALTEYNNLQTQVAQVNAEYEKALADGNQTLIDFWEHQLNTAIEHANEAQKTLLEETEAWAEAINAILENKINALNQGLENTLTGKFGSYDMMSEAFDRANTLQEEYLTTTNKIYETNKLMRNAQSEIDKTSNTVAKKRLKAFIDETQQLQDQAQLSEYELEIQEAKYNLLIAQMALEDTQNAKSTVRLQRDSEGNFGYVYTADSSAVAEAEQQLADAQNDLYNIGLEGANNYSEKYAQILQEMGETLADINEAYRNGEYENEQEYYDAILAAREYYYQQLENYSDLYKVALTTDSRVVQDAWSTEFNDMIYQTQNWKDAVEGYIEEVSKAFAEQGEAMSQIQEITIGKSLNDMDDSINNIVDSSRELATFITDPEDGLIAGLQSEAEEVLNSVAAHNEKIKTLETEISMYENLISAIGQAVNAESKKEGQEESSEEEPGTDGATNEAEAVEEYVYKYGKASETSGLIKSGSGNKTAVKAIQNALNELGYGNSGTKGEDGIFGSGTKKAVKAFQRANGLSYIDGIVGDETRKAFRLAGFDTGGYTGSWGSYGKMAMLHEKELVLNAGDTENFLAAMGILDRIVQAIDLQTASAQLGGLLSAPGMKNLDGDMLEQYVTIDAHFPNVQNSSEIEDAFDTLINRATQYINR